MRRLTWRRDVFSPSDQGWSKWGGKSCYSGGEGGTSISRCGKAGCLVLQRELREWWGDKIEGSKTSFIASVLVQMLSSAMASPRDSAAVRAAQHLVQAVILMLVFHWLVSPETLWLGGSAR